MARMNTPADPLSGLASDFAEALQPEPTWMAECRHSFERYIDHLFMEGDPYNPPSRMGRFQREVARELQKWKRFPMGDARRVMHPVLVLESRGFGKTTFNAIYYPSWRIGTDRDLRFIMLSSAESQAKIFLRAIENILLFKPVYREVFGNLVPDARTLTWTDVEKIVSGRNPMIKDASFFACGVGGAIINRRADIIVADDIVDKENAGTKLQREKVKAWFWEAVRPVLEPGGQLVVSGTRYHAEDLYDVLIRLWQDEYTTADNGLVDLRAHEQVWDRRPCHIPDLHGDPIITNK